MPYTVLQSAFDPFFPKGRLRYYWKSLYLDELDDEAIDAIVERVAAGRPTPLTLDRASGTWAGARAGSAPARRPSAAGRAVPAQLRHDLGGPGGRRALHRLDAAVWSEMPPLSAPAGST